MLVNLEGSARINNLVGNLANHEDLYGIAKQLEIIASEVREGIASLKKGDFGADGFRDDVQDILFTVYGLFFRANINPQRALYTPTPHNYDRYTIGQMSDKLVSYDTVLGLLASETRRLDEIKEAVLPVYYVTLTVLLSSLQKFAYDAGLACSYPINRDYAEVVRSNMTKFDTTLEDAEATRNKYAAIGVETITVPGVYTLDDVPYTVLICKSAKDQVGTDGKDYPDAKWLKSIHFEEPAYVPMEDKLLSAVAYSQQLSVEAYRPVLGVLCDPKFTTEALANVIEPRIWDYIAESQETDPAMVAELEQFIRDNPTLGEEEVLQTNATTLSPEAMDAIAGMLAAHGTPAYTTPSEELKELMATEFSEEFETMSVEEYYEHRATVTKHRLRGNTAGLIVADESPYAEHVNEDTPPWEEDEVTRTA